MTALREYLWIAVLGGILGFAYGFLIGANDVANAFASSVSSKSITLKQAVSKSMKWNIRNPQNFN
jgi:solute carrier family 20 (sodium-dependent phosphate transporter)